MKTVIKIFTVIILLIGFSQNISAAYLKNVPQTITQPDGTIIKCFASGDEFHNWLHDANNYTIIKASDGYYYYADLEDEKLIASPYKVGQVYLKSTNLIPGVNISAEKIREKRHNKLDGRPNYKQKSKLKSVSDTIRINNIVLFIRFSDDDKYTTDTTVYHNLYNNETEAYNSMYNYYQEVSYGKAFIKSYLYPNSTNNNIISYQDTVSRGFFQPYSEVDNPQGYDPDSDDESRNREFDLLERALNYLNANITIPESLDLDYDNDSLVDNISFIIKGDSEGWSDLLWPHNWALYDRIIKINGYRVFNFNFLQENSTIDRGNGVLSHEMGHAMGFPDLYHYSETSTMDPVGPWDIMASTLNPPQGIGAYLKHHVTAWVDTIPEITLAGSYTLNSLHSDTNNVFKIASPYSTDEYFILEYRKREGTFESNLLGSGLLIYRINEDAVSYNGGGNSDGPPDEIYLYRPNGTIISDGDLPNAAFSQNTNRDSISNLSNPTAFLQNGGAGGLYISNIGTSDGSTITFDVDFRPNALYANFIADKTQANIREEIQFTNQSAGSPTTLDWTFEGGIPSSFSGETPPVIIYPETGNFSVTLAVASSEGNSTITKEAYIDVIEIPGTIPPENLGFTSTSNSVTLNWTAPSLLDAEFILQWGDNTPESAVGNVEDPSDATALSHWTPTQIANFGDMYLKEITFFPNTDSELPSVKNYSLRVYTGISAENLILDQSIDSNSISFSQMNTVVLSTPHQIDATTDLWFGVNNNSGTKSSGYPLGVDGGPALTNKGDVFKDVDGLATLLSFGLDNNWILAGLVVNNIETAQKSSNILKQQQAILKSITGYNVYRNEVKVNTALVTETNYTDIEIPNGTYTYYVTTVFTAGESVPSNEINVTIDSPVGIDDLPTKEISIYPNPVRNNLSVAIGELRNQDIQIKIIDQNGRLVYSKSKNISDNKLDIKVNNLNNGMYTLHLIGEDLIYQAKFIIVR